MINQGRGEAGDSTLESWCVREAELAESWGEHLPRKALPPPRLPPSLAHLVLLAGVLGGQCVGCQENQNSCIGSKIFVSCVYCFLTWALGVQRGLVLTLAWLLVLRGRHSGSVVMGL